MRIQNVGFLSESWDIKGQRKQVNEDSYPSQDLGDEHSAARKRQEEWDMEEARMDDYHEQLTDRMERTMGSWVKTAVTNAAGKTIHIVKEEPGDEYGITFMHTGTEDGPMWIIVDSSGNKVGTSWIPDKVEAMLDARAKNKKPFEDIDK